MDQNIGSTNQKIDILRDLKASGCRFRGDSLIQDVQTLQELRGQGFGRKVPWRLIREVLDQIKHKEETEEIRSTLAAMFSCTESSTIEIGSSFRVVPTGVSGVVDLEYTDELKPSFAKQSSSKKIPLKYTQVTKEQIVVFCQTMFDPSIVYPKTVNFTRDWFIVILMLFSAYNPDALHDHIKTQKINDMIRKMTRKKNVIGIVPNLDVIPKEVVIVPSVE
jgi:hypothetical protein